MFVNTELFRQSALYYLKHGYYTDSIPGTKDYLDFWREEQRRCTEGYSVGGVAITGYHYFYLNYFPIMRFSDEAMFGLTKNRKQTKELMMPAFWDGDYEWFWAVEIARNGISVEKYKSLGLSFTIPEYALDGGRHLINIKARRKGYSYKNASMLLCNYYHRRNSINYVFASEEKYLLGDATLDKIWMGMAHNDTNCAWAQPRLITQPLYRKSGYLYTDERGIVTEKGRLNSIQGITFHNDPEKGRGKNGDMILFEEAGKFPNLIKSWIITQQTVEQGGYVGGTMIAFGTGGSDHEDAIGITELFYNPSSYNILPIHNKWDEDLYGQECGYFVPVYQNKEGFMDKDGNSLIEEAKKSEEKKREEKKRTTQEAYKQYTAEMPFTPQEATLQSSTNIFPTKLLTEHRNRVIAKGLHKLAVVGEFVKTDNGVKFVRNDQLQVIERYPHRIDGNLKGAIAIFETPIRLENGIPPNLYYICHDPYGVDDARDKTSLGVAYVMKRNSKYTNTFPDAPVASYIGRPDKQAEYNYNLFLLAQYYGCTNGQIAFENNRGSVIEYARKQKKLSWLAEEFTMDFKKELQGNTQRGYGLTMSQGRKKQGLSYIRDWLLEVVAKNKDGRDVYRLEFIYDLGLLDELIHYSDKGNFDRVSAILIGMYYLKENEDIPVRDKKPVSSHLSQLQSHYKHATVQYPQPNYFPN